MAENLRRPEAIFTFRFIGKHGEYFVYRAPVWATINRNALDAQQFESEVAGWLMDSCTKQWHLGAFKNVPGYMAMPFASENANALCVMIEAEEDVVEFEKCFEIQK